MKDLLEELWEADPDEPFCKIFTRETKKVIQNLLRYSKAELTEISYREDDGSVNNLLRCEAGRHRMILCYQSHLTSKGTFLEDNFRCVSISVEDWDDFSEYPHSIRLIRSTGDATVNPPSN